MTSDVTSPQSSSEQQPAPVESRKPARVWPAVVLVALYWAFALSFYWYVEETFYRFLSMLVSEALLVLLFTTWWLTNRRMARVDRWASLGVAIVSGVVVALLSHEGGSMPWLLLCLPWIITTWTIWLLLARQASPRVRRLGVMTALVLTWSTFVLIRYGGLTGEGKMILHWRWTPRDEDLFRAELAERKSNAARVTPIDELIATPRDWPGFRGPQRDGVVRGSTIDTNWQTSPPAPLWRQRVGPGWSSLAVVGNRLFTQEQRDTNEAVVCFDAANGAEVWVHEDAVRLSDEEGGPGPRATPTFANGLLYTMGSTGILNCLDAVTGQLKWRHDIVAEVGAKQPRWGFSSSPLVIQGLAIVFAEGESEKTLLAYDAHSGELRWTANAGSSGYSSPMRMSLDDTEQVLFIGMEGLFGVDLPSGTVLWRHRLPPGGLFRPIQPHPLGKGRILFASESDGVALLDVKREENGWTISRQWASRALKPSFNDFVVHDGSIYGFDGNTFCCVDAQTGRHRWKKGRYGHGQVLLLAEQSLLLVLSEEGEVILLKANPQAHEEIGRWQAIEGKTWNHPAIANGRLYVRNSKEMACYQLAKAKTP